MKRALIVVVVGLLIGAVSGVTDPSWAFEQAAQARTAHEREIASRVSRIGVDRVVRIEHPDGSRTNALVEQILTDAIVVIIMDGPDGRRETIPFAEIKKIDEVRGRALKKVLIAVGIGVAVLVGTCAVALSSGTPPQSKS